MRWAAPFLCVVDGPRQVSEGSTDGKTSTRFHLSWFRRLESGGSADDAPVTEARQGPSCCALSPDTVVVTSCVTWAFPSETPPGGQ